MTERNDFVNNIENAVPRYTIDATVLTTSTHIKSPNVTKIITVQISPVIVVTNM